MEKQSNPEIKPNNKVQSNPTQDDYSLMQEQIKKQQAAQSQNLNYVPENPVDTAHLLLSDSELTTLMPEIDKEIKLANLDSIEKYATYQFLSLWNDLMWQRKQQMKKIMEAKIKFGKLYDFSGEDQLLEQIESEFNEVTDVFDGAGALRKGMIVPTLSRGKFGFERIQQVKTISEYKMESIDKSEQNPGFMQRFMGGFRR